MSIESTPDPFAADFYIDFRDVQIDPFVTRIFAMIREYNALIDGEYMESDQINAIMIELDNEWRQLLRHDTQFTGLASFLSVDAHGSEGAPVREFYQDETFEFNGVMPSEVDSRDIFDVKLDKFVEHYTYVLRLQVSREALDKDGAIVKLVGTAEVDDIVSLQFHNLMSVDGARKWLSYYHAEDIDYIEIDLFNEAKEECEKALRLSEHAVDIGTPHKGDERLALRSTQALDAFTNSMISFDPDAPYLLEVEGDAWDPLQDGTIEPAYLKGKQMAALDRIVWLKPIGETRQIVTPHVAVRLLHESHESPPTNMLIPLSAVKSLRSYRHGYYFGYDGDTTGQ